MRSLPTESFGSLDHLRVIESPDPVPGPGQVGVAVEAAGVNFVDGLIVQGRYQFTPPPPHIPGTEVAGTEAAVGEGVDGLAVGQRVVALPATGGYSSHVVVPDAAAGPTPSSIRSEGRRPRRLCAACGGKGGTSSWASPAGPSPRFPINQVLLNSRTVIGIELGGWVRRDPGGYLELMALVAAGDVHPVEPTAWPLDQGPAVLAALQNREVTGKAVLLP